MNVTVCEVPDAPDRIDGWWRDLAAHVRAHDSKLVLLGEMPFVAWPGAAETHDRVIWEAAMAAHAAMETRFPELGDVVLATSRPAMCHGRPVHEAVLWDPRNGLRAVHQKYYLPNEPGFWEAAWYDRGPGTFEAVDTPVGRVGFLMCTELWFTEHARAYARDGVQFLLCPRATAAATRDRWVSGGIAAAVMSGAYCLSANRGGTGADGTRWAGTGWVIHPETAEVLALTDEATPFQTVTVDPAEADAAKQTYPRYVPE